MRRLKSFVLVTVAAAGMLVLAGCKDYELAWWNWFDPSRPLRAPGETAINPIFNQAGPADQTMELLPNAETPRPADLEYAEEDYVIGPTDVLNISILDLYQEGLETILQRQVSHAGYIDLPLVERRVKATGLTQQELVEVVKGAYRPNVLKDPNVSITVVVRRGNTFSILGAISRPGTYNILRRDFTLLEALALAGDVTQSKIEWVYVIRPRKKAARAPGPTPPEPVPAVNGTGLPEIPKLPELPSLPSLPTPGATTQPAKAATQPGGPSIEDQLRELEKAIPGVTVTPGMDQVAPVALSAMGTEPVPARGASTTPRTVPSDLESAAVTYKWMYVDGRWVRQAQPVTPATAPTPKEAPVTRPARPLATAPAPGDEKDPFGWAQYDMSHLSRLVAVNLDKLKAGDPRMNIIIRDNDIVHVPNLEVGEFYVMGEVARPGAYALTGRRVTVKQAVAAAGNIGALGWPNNSILIRRIGRDQEQVMPLKLQDIMSSKEPDLFLKPDDTIAVGSYWAAPFLAVWRNAFRMTYGFGFIYDRNYSVSDFEVPVFFPSKGPR